MTPQLIANKLITLVAFCILVCSCEPNKSEKPIL